jgi:hypothetical protein
VNGPSAATIAAAALALLWLFIAVAIAVAAARRIRLAQQVLEAARSNARLLELMPARPLLVRADGRIEVDAQLLRELGLETVPGTLAGLADEDRGIAREDLDSLGGDIGTAQASSGRVARAVRVSGSSRIFDVRGGPAPDGDAGDLLLWFFDTSAAEEERAKLALRLRHTESALNSLTQLIEAAPFPM